MASVTALVPEPDVPDRRVSVADHIASRDWSASPIGPRDRWPAALSHTVDLILASEFPICLLWGSELISLHNDAYGPFLRGRSEALGRPFADVWPEVWPKVGPIVERALAGTGSYFADLPLSLVRDGREEPTWWTFSCSPVRLDDESVGGVLCTVIETTESVVARRRLEFRGDLADELRSAPDPEALLKSATRALGQFLDADRVGFGEVSSSNKSVRPQVDWTNGTLPSLAGAIFRKGASGPHLVAQLDTGKTVTLDDCLTDPRTADPSDAAIFTRLGIRALLAVPLARGGKLRAVLYVHSREPRHWTESEIAAAEETALRSWDALVQLRADAALRAMNETLERKIAERTAERHLLATIFETTDSFVQVSDMEFRWLAINKASADEFERIFGVRPKVGDCMLDLLNDRPEHQAAVRAVWARALGGEEFTEIGEFGDLDKRFYEMVYNVLRDAGGQQIGAFQIVRDVTARVKAQRALEAAEEALRQSQKMEAVGQLTGGIAHDFNNLLQVISGNLEIIARAAPDEPRVSRAAKNGLRGAARAAAITQRLLAFSRRQPLKPRALDVNRLIPEISDLLNRALGETVRLEMALEGDPWTIKADPNQLESALVNLAVNARDAMPAGGSLRLSTANLRADGPARAGAQASEYLVLTVRDDGEGMAPEVLARVFEPFFTTKPAGKGTGLGLAMVHNFMTESGGRIEVDSAQGLGTAVSLWFPRLHGEAVREEAPLADAVPPAIAGSTLLLVEDDDDVREYASEALRELGYRVLEAMDGGSAMRIVSDGARRIDAMVCDLVLPNGMDGVELARNVAAARPELPILFTSGFGAHCIDTDADGSPPRMVLAKPFSTSELACGIRDCIAQSA